MPQKYILGRQAKNRSMIIRYCAVIGITLFLNVILQTSVLSRSKPFGVTPDLMICTVLIFSFFLGCHAGGITGIVAGFLTDAFGSVGFSLLPLIYFLVGYFIGHYIKVLNARRYLFYLPALGITLIVRLFTTLIYTLLSASDFHFPSFMLKLALPELLGTALFGAVLYFPIYAICRWLTRRG